MWLDCITSHPFSVLPFIIVGKEGFLIGMTGALSYIYQYVLVLLLWFRELHCPWVPYCSYPILPVFMVRFSQMFIRYSTRQDIMLFFSISNVILLNLTMISWLYIGFTLQERCKKLHQIQYRSANWYSMFQTCSFKTNWFCLKIEACRIISHCRCHSCQSLGHGPLCIILYM